MCVCVCVCVYISIYKYNTYAGAVHWIWGMWASVQMCTEGVLCLCRSHAQGSQHYWNSTSCRALRMQSWPSTLCWLQTHGFVDGTLCLFFSFGMFWAICGHDEKERVRVRVRLRVRESSLFVSVCNIWIDVKPLLFSFFSPSSRGSEASQQDSGQRRRLLRRVKSFWDARVTYVPSVFRFSVNFFMFIAYHVEEIFFRSLFLIQLHVRRFSSQRITSMIHFLSSVCCVSVCACVCVCVWQMGLYSWNSNFDLGNDKRIIFRQSRGPCPWSPQVWYYVTVKLDMVADGPISVKNRRLRQACKRRESAPRQAAWNLCIWKMNIMENEWQWWNIVGIFGNIL